MSPTGAPSFGTLLKRYRRAAGLTQEALADRAGLSVRGIQDLERGASRAPRRDTLEMLASALGLTTPERAVLVAASSRQNPSPRRPADLADDGDGASLYPLVGRRREQAILDDFLAGKGALPGRAPLLLLSGEPGIGKTRLLEAAAQRAHEQGWCVLMGGLPAPGRTEAVRSFA